MFEKKKPKDGSERRQFPRLAARNLIKIKRPGGADIERLTNIFDISEGGLRMVCHEKIPVGTVLDVAVNIPEKNAVIGLSGKIAWVKEMKGQKGAFYAGVAFTYVNESDREMIRNLIQTRLERGERQVPED